MRRRGEGGVYIGERAKKESVEIEAVKERADMSWDTFAVTY